MQLFELLCNIKIDMKKKLFILVLAASICGSVLLSGDAFADATCTIAGSGITPKKYCAGTLYRQHPALKNYCNTSSSVFSESNCKEQIKRHLTCNNSIASDACSASKTSYANDVYSIIHDNNVDPCAGKTGDAYRACINSNWEYYSATAPSSSNNGGGGDGGGGGGSSSSSPDSGDDSGNTETVDPAPVNEGDCTSILPNAWCTGDDGIQQIIRLIILILTGSIVVAGTVGIIICGFLWMTARENEQQVATAKKRMLDIIIGVVAWVLLALLANLFIPKPSDEIQKNVNGNVSVTKDIEG